MLSLTKKPIIFKKHVQTMDMICKNLFRKMRCFGGTESQRKILQKFVPQKKYSLEVTYVVPFHTQEPGN